MQQWVEGNKLIKLEKETSRLRMGGGSWTINLDLLPDNVSVIEYRTHVARYTIDLAWAKEKGFERNFQDENKLVVPIKNWRIRKGVKNGSMET